MVARLTLVHFRWFVITDCPSEQIKRQVGGRKRTAVPIAPIAIGGTGQATCTWEHMDLYTSQTELNFIDSYLCC